MRALFAPLLLALVCPALASAQSDDLDPAARGRCIQSIVRVEVETPRGSLSGSGTILDPRGYILTNFHVVGHISRVTGTPGVQHAARYRVAVVRSERARVVDEYYAEVVRGHVSLDLALLRIVARVDGAPFEGETFESLSIRDELPPLATRVWALGFPARVRTIHITAGQIAGFEDNAHGEVAWMRTDTEFNPGNSGGALIDQACRLVGVPTAMSRDTEPIELARPAVRVPAEWLAAIRAPSAPEPTPAEGLRELTVLTESVDAELGDASSTGSELRYYRLPRARPGVAMVSPRLPISVIGPGGRVVRFGSGQALVTASDGPQTIIAVTVPSGRDGQRPTLRVRYAPMRDEDVSIAAAEGEAIVRGRVTRADGSACATYAALAPAELDPAPWLAEVREGTRSESELRALLEALTPLEPDGSFSLRASPGAHALWVLGPRGLEHRALVQLGPEPFEVGALELEQSCR